MSTFENRGNEIRQLAKSLVYEFMQSNAQCQPNSEVVLIGVITLITSSNQQYWVGAIVQELKSEGKIERISESGPWRLI